MAYRAATNAGGVIEQRLQAMKAEPCEVQAKDYYCVVTRADFVKLPPLSAYLKESPDGYRLYADEQSIVIQRLRRAVCCTAGRNGKSRGIFR